MLLGDIPAGTRVVVDANILPYHAIGVPDLTPVIASFQKRVESGEIQATTSTVLLAEALRRHPALERVEAPVASLGSLHHADPQLH